jgi:hypothetical protein
LAGWAKLQQDEAGFTGSQNDQNFKTDLLARFDKHGGILAEKVIPIDVYNCIDWHSLPEYF